MHAAKELAEALKDIRYNSEAEQRTLDALRWGIDPKLGEGRKNRLEDDQARVETVETAPSYRGAFKKRRCPIPVDGFYEWKKVLDDKIPLQRSDEGRLDIRFCRALVSCPLKA